MALLPGNNINMTVDSKELIHRKLLRRISDYFIDDSYEYDIFLEHFKPYGVPRYILAQKDLFKIFDYLESMNLLYPGKYETLKEIARINDTFTVLEYIQDAEQDIEMITDQDSANLIHTESLQASMIDSQLEYILDAEQDIEMITVHRYSANLIHTDSKELIHRTLLRRISDYFIDDIYKYYIFLEHFKPYEVPGYILAQKDLFQIFDYLESMNLLYPGKYETLKAIARNSRALIVLKYIEEAEQAIEMITDQDSVKLIHTDGVSELDKELYQKALLEGKEEDSSVRVMVVAPPANTILYNKVKSELKNSIRSRDDKGEEPPIILVGTHRDACTNPEDYMLQVRKLFLGQNSTLYNHFNYKDFAVENAVESDEHVNELFKYIEKLSDKKDKVPVKWIQMDVALSESEQLKDKKIVPFTTVQEVNSMTECPIDDIAQLKLYLRTRHSQGNIIYFDEASLGQYVVLEPQYLIDAFRCLITTKRNRMMPKVIKWWTELYHNANLYKSLLEEIWIGFKENFEVLLMFLEKYRLIAKIHSYSKIDCTRGGAASCVISEDSEYFIVPCFLKPDDNERVEAFYKRKEATKTIVSLVYRFECTTILPTIYQQITAAAIGKWPVFAYSDDRLLFDTVGVYQLPHKEENNVGIIRTIETDIYLTVVTRCEGTIDSTSCYDFKQFVDDIIEHVFKKFDSGIHFKKYIRCTCKYVDQTKEKLKGIDELLASGKWFPCEHENHIDKMNAYEQWCPKEIHNQQVSGSQHPANRQCTQHDKLHPAMAAGRTPEGELTDKNLTYISNNIGDGWELLAAQLNVSHIKVQHIKEDHKQSQQRIYNMLQLWRSTNRHNATMTSLFDEMYKAAGVSIDWIKLQEMVGPVDDDE